MRKIQNCSVKEVIWWNKLPKNLEAIRVKEYSWEELNEKFLDAALQYSRDPEWVSSIIQDIWINYVRWN